MTTTMIDKSVSLRNSMDLNNRASVDANAPHTSSGHFNSRGTSIDLSQSLRQREIKKQQNDNKRILALNFVEVILADRQKLLDFSYDIGSKGKASLLYLKFKFLGETHHTKFISLSQRDFESRGGVSDIQSMQMKALNLAAFEINKTVLLSLDLSDQA